MILRRVPATSSVLTAVAKGIIQANDNGILLENGGHLSWTTTGHGTFCIEWILLVEKWQDAHQQEFLWHQRCCRKQNLTSRGRYSKCKPSITFQMKSSQILIRPRSHTCLRETALCLKKELKGTTNKSPLQGKGKRSK